MKPRWGFEIALTEPLAADTSLNPNDLLVKQWWYRPTPNYGGPKMDVETLKITGIKISEDRKRISLEIAGLKKEHVVYFRLPEYLKSDSGQPLWSSEAWYTLNNIPDGQSTEL